jgi:5-methylcytosine-specific restriction enzyme A
MGDLDERFEHDMIETVYRTAGRETGYWASYFLRAVKRHGGVGAARRMLGTKGLSKGLTTLREKGRLDLALETLVLRPEYRTLFTDEERAIAARRLDQVESGTAPGAAIAGSARGPVEP